MHCDQPGLATGHLIGPEPGEGGRHRCVACNDGDLTSGRVIAR